LLLDGDVAVLVTTGPDGEAHVAAWSGPDGSVDRAGGFAASDVGVSRFVRPDLVTARLEAPLQRAGETIGLLMVGASRSRGFEVDEVETLSSLANQAAIAIENARLQARLRELAVDAERERIAREMHDGLAQVLGYVNTKSQAIEQLLVAGRTREARGLLAELAAAARSIYVDVREAILGLRSPVVPGVGLVAAVEDYATRFTEASKIAVAVEATPGARRLDLSPQVEAQVFRIVQEALTNVRKHSGAARATVSFAVGDGRLDVSVADDGHGFAISAAPTDLPRYGIEAMRERAHSIAGTVEWSSPASGGCRVELSVMVEVPPEPATTGVA
jgi:signal transduction histidine kinase